MSDRTEIFHTHHHYICGDPRMDEAIRLLREILSQLGKIMAVSKQELALLDTMNAATNAVADQLTALRQQLADADSPADTQAVLDGMTALASHLTAIAADPNAPVPPAPVIPPPAP